MKMIGCSVSDSACSDSLQHDAENTVPEAGGWRQYRVESLQEQAPDSRLLTIGGASYVNKSSLVSVTGKAKNGKTFFAQATAIALLRGEYLNMTTVQTDAAMTVLFVDTEQGPERSRAMLRRINKVTGESENDDNPRLVMLSLRELPSGERFLRICEAITELQPTVAIIDGIRDCVMDFNDIHESMQVVNELLRMATSFGTAIVVLIHTNKSDSNARGHLGTELTNKSETVVEVQKNKSIISVLPQACRDIDFKPFSMTIIDEGFTQLSDTDVFLPILNEPLRQKSFLDKIFGNEKIMGSEELDAKIQEKLGVSPETAMQLVSRAMQSGIIRKTGGRMQLMTI